MGRLYVTDGRVLRGDGRIVQGDVVIDDGRIEAIEDAVDPGGGTHLDAEEALVVPGFVNAHSHVAMTLMRGVADDKPLHAWLEEDIFPLEAALEPEDVAAGARLGLLEAIKAGTTGICDMYFHEGEIADAVAEAGVRGLLGYGIITLGKDEAAIEEELETALRFARQYQEAGGGRIRTGLMPHAVNTVDPEVLERVASLADERELPVHFHANETRADVETVRERDGRPPIATAERCGLLDVEAFVAHAVHLEATEIDRLAETDTGVVHCPTANLKLASGMAPLSALLEAGVPVGIGTDGPASNNDLDLLEDVRLAALLAKVREGDAAVVPAETAIELGTAGGANLLGLGGGGIEPGAPADIAVIDLRSPHFAPDHDLVSHLAYVATGADVRHTVCAGRVLMRDRRVLSLDETAVRRRATDRAKALVERAG